MTHLEDHLDDMLHKRITDGMMRRLKLTFDLVDFTSNDYLGLCKNPKVIKSLDKLIKKHAPLATGSGGSRLLSGNTQLAMETERKVADFHGAESALIFSSGYAANLGMFSALVSHDDVVIIDELVHASIHDGIRLSGAKRIRFAHNDVNDLRKKLSAARGRAFVIVESVYSMDGDLAPLDDISNLCKEFQAALFVDEAHAVGVFGEQGRGLVQPHHEVYGRVVTFGKALGAHGAAVLGSRTLIQYLINFARSFIYSTAPAPHFYLTIQNAYDWLPELDKDRAKLQKLIEAFAAAFGKGSPSPVQTVMIPGNDNARSLAEHVQKGGYDVRPILSPTVSAGSERLRICLHTSNTPEQIAALRQLCKEWKPQS